MLVAVPTTLPSSVAKSVRPASGASPATQVATGTAAAAPAAGIPVSISAGTARRTDVLASRERATR